jgi:hypothetical protein
MRALVATLCLTFCAVAAWAAKASAADPIDALDRFSGTWKSHGTFVDSPYGKAGPADATTTCAWSSGHTFVICQQSVSMNGKTNEDIALYTYDPDAKVYRFFNVQPSKAVPLIITIDGNTVTYPVSFKDGSGHDVVIRTLNVWENPAFYRWRTEYSTDAGKTWIPMASGTSQRQ